MEKLTNKQIIILDFIKKYTAKNGYSPTIREICEGVHLSSPATVFVHIKNLETKGYITSTNNKFRTISLLVDNEYDEKECYYGKKYQDFVQGQCFFQT